jgi:PKD domain-containing protein
VAVALATLSVPSGVALAAAPTASFSISPAAPQTLDPVTFTSTSTGGVTSSNWDLDNDGSCDDAAGSSARRSFPVPGTYRVTLCVTGPGGSAEQTQNISVRNRPPVAWFVRLPVQPETGDLVSFVSTSRDPDGPIASFSWDLDSDGLFGDAAEILALRTFSLPGSYVIRLRVTDTAGAQATAAQVVSVKPSLLSPFPVVRVAGAVEASGMTIRLLKVEAPHGAHIKIRCRGRGCPRRRVRGRAGTLGGPLARSSKLWRFPRFERRLGAGAVLKVLVTQRGRIGKYTRLSVRGGRPPRRKDLCIFPGSKRPRKCPAR